MGDVNAVLQSLRCGRYAHMVSDLPRQLKRVKRKAFGSASSLVKFAFFINLLCSRKNSAWALYD
jgi:hypothetical protein